MRSRVDQFGPAVLKALHGGASVAQAAASAGVAENTVRTWIKTGRRDPDGRFGPFAADVERDRRRRNFAQPVAQNSSQAVGRNSAGQSAPPDRAELIVLLGGQAQQGNVRATELPLRETPADRSAEHERNYQRLKLLAPPP